MAELNIIMVNDENLGEIWAALKSRKNILVSYNKIYVASRDDFFQKGEDEKAKEVEEAMFELDKVVEKIDNILQSIEK